MWPSLKMSFLIWTHLLYTETIPQTISLRWWKRKYISFTSKTNLMDCATCSVIDFTPSGAGPSLEMLESGSNRTSRAKSNSEEEVVVRVSLKSQLLVSFLRDDHSYNRLVLLCNARWVWLKISSGFISYGSTSTLGTHQLPHTTDDSHPKTIMIVDPCVPPWPSPTRPQRL